MLRIGSQRKRRGSGSANEAQRKRSCSSDAVIAAAMKDMASAHKHPWLSPLHLCLCNYTLWLPPLRLPCCACFACCHHRPANVCCCSRPSNCRTRMLPFLPPPCSCLAPHLPSWLPGCKLRSYIRLSVDCRSTGPLGYQRTSYRCCRCLACPLSFLLDSGL